mmetsp:Transcript_20772/g.43525  ORF Transcript_20772/g.43525 Transcript_20772/m.43525 type:complete len:206 (+) Transcript_20772:197-814(+)
MRSVPRLCRTADARLLSHGHRPEYPREALEPGCSSLDFLGGRLCLRSEGCYSARAHPQRNNLSISPIWPDWLVWPAPSLGSAEAGGHRRWPCWPHQVLSGCLVVSETCSGLACDARPGRLRCLDAASKDPQGQQLLTRGRAHRGRHHSNNCAISTCPSGPSSTGTIDRRTYHGPARGLQGLSGHGPFLGSHAVRSWRMGGSRDGR